MVAALGMEQEIPDYDLDSEDEGWLGEQTKKMEITPIKFEVRDTLIPDQVHLARFMAQTLEAGCLMPQELVLDVMQRSCKWDAAQRIIYQWAVSNHSS